MKNKITIFVIAFCSLCFCAEAGIVPVQDAQNVALNFFKIATGSQALRTPLMATLKYTRFESNGSASMYAFDISPVKGFVIVSASDYEDPIIGYSTESFFATGFSKTGLKELLGRWGQEIAYVERSHVMAEPKTALLWSCYRQGVAPVNEKSTGIGPLCTTSWNQSADTGTIPALYNEDCPFDVTANANTLTGCVATAMAQIMKYWNFPSHGTGRATYNDEVSNGFSNNYGVLNFNFGNTYFNWAAMPDNLTANSTVTQDSAVSLLNYACGVAVSMDYGPAESGAWVIQNQSPNGASSQQAYPLYFRYNPTTLQAILFTNYTNYAWIQLIENELNAGRPVQYQGFDVNAGSHTWVCDGYNTSDMLHMNWGWGGSDNGWYAVTNLQPNSGNDFTYNIGALIGIEPGVEAVAAPAAICAGGTSVLYITGGPEAASYAWAPATGLSCTNCASPQATPANTTTYTVTIDSAGNTVTASVTVFVDHPNTLNYSLSDSVLCLGNTAALSFIGVSGVSISPSASAGWSDSVSAILSPDTTTTYHVLTQSSVCGSGDSANIKVQVTPYLPVTINLSSTTVCHGSNATLSYIGLSNVTVTPSGYSYSAGNNVIVFDPTATTSFSVSGTTSCGSTYTDTFTITVNTNSGVLSYTLSKPTICKGDTTVLIVSNGSNVQVSPANVVTALGGGTFLLAPDSNTTFYVTGFNAACGGQASVQIPVNVIQTDSLSYSVSNQDLCIGGYETIYLYGVTGNVHSNPILNFYFSDSTDAYAYFVADSAKTYAITATTICGLTGTANVSINVLPLVSYTLQRQSICHRDSTLFTVTGLTGLAIYPTTGFRMIDSSNYEFNPDETTSYELDGYDCNGQYNYYSFTINVVSPGVLSYTLQDSDLCSALGTQLNINGVYTPQINPYNYFYTTDSADSYAYLYPQVTTNYTVTGESVCGGMVSTSFMVYVYPTAGYSLGAASVCAGGSTTLKVNGLSSPSISPLNNAVWVNDSVIVLSPTSQTEYVLSGTDCTGQQQQYNVVVGVLENGAVSYTVDSELCSGNQAYLTISGADNIVLNPAASLIYTDSFDAYAYLSPTTTTGYTFTATAECSAQQVQDSFNVYIIEIPSSHLSNGDICSGDTAMLTTMGLDNPQLSPSTNAGFINGNTAYLYPDTTTTYTLSGTSSCTNASFNQTVTVTVGAGPTGAALNISEQNDTLFAAIATSYQWMVNGNVIPGATDSYLVPVATGTYTVLLGGSSNCHILSNPFAITGVGAMSANKGYRVYPNPSSGKWTIQASVWASGTACELYDNTGRRVYRSIITSAEYQINTEVSEGMYLLKIVDATGTLFMAKVVKM